jgi:PAS domain S-box-containing protein
MIGSLQNEGLFQSIFQSTAEGIFVVNKEGTILMANPACKNQLDYNPDDLLGKNIEGLFLDKHSEEIKSHLTNIQNKTFYEHFYVVGIKKDNTQINLEIRINSIKINNKKLSIIFLRDASNHQENLLKIKQTNKALLESNRKFETLIDSLQGIVYRCKNDKDWTMEYINKGCVKITGYNAASFLGGTLHFSHIIFKEDQEQVWNDTQKGINDKKPFALNYRIRDKKGNVRYLQELGQGVFDNNGNLEAIEGFISDVTSQKNTELTLKASEAKVKALLEAIPDMMFIQDYNGTYLDFYAPLEQKLSTPPDTIIGKNMIDILPSETYKKIKKAQEKTIANKQIQLIEYKIKTKDKTNHYEARIVLLNNHSILSIVRNISEAKAQEALLKIRNNALASVDSGIIISDAQQPKTPIIYCNAAFEKITGYKKEEVYGKNCNFLQSDDRTQSEIDTMKNAIIKGESCKVILRNYKKDGTLFWNEIAITPIRNQKKELTHFIGVQNDVSARVKDEHLKNQVRNILELITQDKPLKAIGNTIIETVETHFSDCIASILVLNKEQKTLHDLVSLNVPNDFSKLLEGLEIGPKAGSCGTAAFLKNEIIVSNIQTNILWEDYKDIRESAFKNEIKACWSFPILSSASEVLGTFAIYSKQSRRPLPAEKEIILDMTYLASVAMEKYAIIIALKENKIALEKYTQKLEDIVQERTQEVMETVQNLVATNLNLEDQIRSTKKAEDQAIKSKILTVEIAKNFPKGLIAVIDKDLKLVLAEGEALESLGLTPLIFEGMGLDDVSIFAEERKTRIKEDISKTLSGQHLTFEIEFKNRYFAVNTAPLFDENNEIMYALMVYNNITEQKEFEFSIQNALKKEQELNELKSRFVSMASHEFRTPLSAILTSAILIGKQNEHGKEHKRKKYVVQIENNVNHLITILNDFLSLSKLEEGKTKAVNDQFELIHFAKILINESKVNLKKGQHITFNTAIEHLFVKLDAKLLRHIITNLLSNASKYAPEYTIIKFKITESDNKVLIQITDQGIGIPEDEQKQLFDRFYRAKNALNIEGTGLGLNIAKHYAELMGGTIGFVSKLNEGTTFWIEFPIDTNE